MCTQKMMQKVALISFDSHLSYAAHAQELTSQIRSHIEYLVLIDSIAVLV